MNTLILISLLCLVCSPPADLGSAVTFSPGLGRVTGVVTSGEVLRMVGEVEREEELSGTHGEASTHDTALQMSEEEERRTRRKGKGKRRNKHHNKHTTAFQPDTQHTTWLSSNSTAPHSPLTSAGHSPLTSAGHTPLTSAGHTPLTSAGHTPLTSAGHTPLTSAGQTSIVTSDPCGSSHLTYCIHGTCKYMDDLKEAVCVCMKGFDGERCGIQLLGSRNMEEEEGSRGEMLQTGLVIIAVVLSLISCIAILMMACAHYRTQKNFLSAYLGSASEKAHLQTPPTDVTV